MLNTILVCYRHLPVSGVPPPIGASGVEGSAGEQDKSKMRSWFSYFRRPEPVPVPDNRVQL